MVEVEIMGLTKSLLVDTGAEICILREAIPGVPIKAAGIRARGVTGAALGILGTQEVTCNVANLQVTHQFVIATVDIPGDGLIGWDVLKKLGAVIDAKSQIITFTGVATSVIGTNNIKGAATQALVQGPNPVRTNMQSPQVSTIWRLREDTQDNMNWISASKNHTIPAYSEMAVQAQTNLADGQLFVTEPLNQPQLGIRIGRSLNVSRAGNTVVRVMNLTAAPIQIDKQQYLGRVDFLEMEDDQVEPFQVHAISSLETSGKLQETLVEKTKHLPRGEAEQIQVVLEKYQHLFGEPGRDGCQVNVQHCIPTADSAPIAKRPYRVPYHLHPVVEEHLADMLDKGIISPSTSPWSAPVVLVKKKTTDGSAKWRFCTDF
ncbi:uncharacterized protein LOC120351144 [Nilaparvata lugens]|uniref:uncharacterized protein LOC120351144 n=1 Tax=Nilaparvata lugens TaxID=108931 RepID=UPI00193EB551|nr:uncharacterized protein LOC120351144 [Nilaparvata lugens]